MNITIEMIERVLEATDADYYKIKEALIAADGDVDAAIEALKAAQEEVPVKAMPEEELTAETPEAEEAEAAEEGAEEETEAEKEEAEEDWNMEDFAEKMIERLKKRIEQGNVERIRISRDGKTILDIPLGLGILGGLFAFAAEPWAAILGVLTAMGLKCKVEVITKDGDSEEM